MPPIPKHEALRILSEEHREVSALVERLRPGDQTRGGLGGGEWSPKDLLGHLSSWEEHALAAIDAWAGGKTAPIDRALRAEGLHAVNRRAVAQREERPLARVRAEFEEIHSSLVEAIEGTSPGVWDAPPTRRSRRSLGERVGAILGGAGGGFHHAAAHLPDLRTFVDERSAG